MGVDLVEDIVELSILKISFVAESHLQPSAETSSCCGVKPGCCFLCNCVIKKTWKNKGFLKDAGKKTLSCLEMDPTQTLTRTLTQECCLCGVVWEGLYNSASCLTLWYFFICVCWCTFSYFQTSVLTRFSVSFLSLPLTPQSYILFYISRTTYTLFLLNYYFLSIFVLDDG